MAKIKFLALGGQDERDKNAFYVEVDNEIYLFNAGVKVPVNGALGINMITPDFSYLKENQHKIKGLFIGYPTFPNMAGIPYLVDELDVQLEIFTSEIGRIVIETYFEKKLKHLKVKVPKITVVQPINDFKVGHNFVTAFKISNSMPWSFGWVLKTTDGAIVCIDDFIINNDKTKAFDSQIQFLPNITKQNTLALITTMGNVGNFSGFTAPNFKNKAFYEGVIGNAKGRVIVACNNKDSYTILTLATIAKNLSRPFIIYSNTFLNVFSGIIKNKIFNSKGLLSLPITEINKSENAIVVIVDHKDNLFSKLFSIVEKKLDILQLKETDTFVLGTQLLPGYEGQGARLLDALSIMDIDNFVLPKTILPLMASDEDQKQLINLLKPKYVFPVQGLYKNYVNYERVITQTWVKHDQIYFLYNGEGYEINDGKIAPKMFTVKLTEKYINQAGILDVGSSILHERKQMANNGIILLTIPLDKKNQKFVKEIQLESYGVIKENEETKQEIQEIQETFLNLLGENIVLDAKKMINIKETKLNIKKILAKLFEKKFNKRPVVLPSIIEV